MLHYHGTPLTPRSELETLSGRSFCVSYADSRDLAVCLRIGASVMADNGAFSAFTRGKAINIEGYYRWLAPWLRHPHWAVIPDEIGGDEAAQRKMVATWPFSRDLGAPVWHLHMPLDYLRELADVWPRICFGSSAEFWNTRTDTWRKRIDQAWDVLAQRQSLPWVHMLRAMREASRGNWPFASADSVNLARNYKDRKIPAVQVATKIETLNPPALWRDTATPQMEIKIR